MIPFNNFKRKYKTYKKEIDDSIKRVFEKGWFILGPELNEFESDFSKFLKVKHTVGVDSGTDAIFLALKAYGVGNGDEVITVANTATPTVSAIRMTGATPVFVDVNDNTLLMDVSQIEEKINSKTKAIVPVHLYGYPVNMDIVMKVARRHSLKVVEDACQAHGAKFGGKMVGTIGDAGCFSFYPTKNLGAFGDAGAVTTNDDSTDEILRKLRNYGEVTKFKNKIEGFNARLDEIQASILKWGLKHLLKWNKKRETLSKLYCKLLKDLPLRLPPLGNKNEERIWHLFVIRTKERNEIRSYLQAHGIETFIHYPIPIHLQEAYQFLELNETHLPVTNNGTTEILSLPLYPELSEKEVKEVCSAIKDFYKERKLVL